MVACTRSVSKRLVWKLNADKHVIVISVLESSWLRANYLFLFHTILIAKA